MAEPTLYKLIIRASSYDALKLFPQVWIERKGGKKSYYAEYPKLAHSLEEAAQMKSKLREQGFKRVVIDAYE